MAEPNIEAPATPAPAAASAAEAPTSAGASARRAAAFAALPEDMHAADVADDKAPPEDDEGGAGDAPPAAAAPPPAAEPPKPAEPDPLASRAAADRYLMQQREQLKQERDAIAKERADWEASRKDAPDGAAEVAKLHRTLAADPVAYADAQNWTPAQRYAAAQALSWSAHPEDKRPPGWRGNGQGAVLSEVEQVKAELAKERAARETFEKTLAGEKQAQRERAEHVAVGQDVLKNLPGDAPYAKAYAETHPAEAVDMFASIAKELIAAEMAAVAKEPWREPKMVGYADVAKEFERRSDEAYQRWAWREKVKAGTAAAAPPAKAPPVKVPSAASTASPSRGDPKVANSMSREAREQRKREALAGLPDKLD